ncbi:CLUMA_CG002833, isoform A [Clunio marinus]|uniref:CLUMA_CG002833, isoform A n=1 Tax=Clunio marinus TaxID=568069 RepID=A0A1J1HLX3_9DIPT|nr:CLUMA_CG002833, isoform A [Clunio marinus]
MSKKSLLLTTLVVVKCSDLEKYVAFDSRLKIYISLIEVLFDEGKFNDCHIKFQTTVKDFYYHAGHRDHHHHHPYVRKKTTSKPNQTEAKNEE